MGNLPAVIGPYRIVRQLGEGGMGAVYEAVHEVIQRRVAVKVLHAEAGRSPETINRFLNEARAANLVHHPGLVQITDFGNLPDGAGFLVMEYLQGPTLAGRLLGSGGQLSPSETVQIGIQIASALATTHKKGIIHRDLKPRKVATDRNRASNDPQRCEVLAYQGLRSGSIIGIQYRASESDVRRAPVKGTGARSAGRAPYGVAM